MSSHIYGSGAFPLSLLGVEDYIASDHWMVDTKTFNPSPLPPHPTVYLDSIFFLLCMWRNSAVTYVLTCLKNNVLATGDSKKLVATVLGCQSLIAAMYLYNNNNSQPTTTSLYLSLKMMSLKYYGISTFKQTNM